MLYKEPLLHFLLLGALIFIAYGFMNADTPSDDEIVVSLAQQKQLVNAFTVTWKRPPTSKEFQGIVENWIREEIAYREAVAMELDSNDSIIRRRLRQKLELLADDIVSIVEPTNEELEQYLAENSSDYLDEPHYSLQQIFFSIDSRGEATQQDAEQALLLLQTDDMLTNPQNLGDSMLFAYRLENKSESELSKLFGREFVLGLERIEPGDWQGPIQSAYGLHLIKIDQYQPGRALSLEEVKNEVKRDWHNQMRQRAIDTLYEQLGGRYTIIIESPVDETASGL